MAHRAWLRIAVALCLAVLGLTVSAAASVEADKKTPKCFGKKATIVGTNKGETIKGTKRADVIVAKGGHDRIKAKGGDDLVCAGPGDDVVGASGGKDRVFGEAGNDKLSGGLGNDTLDAGVGNDTVDGGGDTDTLLGGEGDDRLFDSSGTNTLNAGPGADAVVGGTGPDVVRGGAGDDDIVGGNGNDQLFGEAGTDNLEGGTGNDELDGGDGDDAVGGGDGLDHVAGGSGNDGLVGGLDQDELVGGDGNDTLDAGPGNDDLDGGAGKDDMTGGPGADELRGGDGTDQLRDDSVDIDSYDGQNGVDICDHGPEDNVAVDCDFDQDDPVILAPYQQAAASDPIDVAADATIKMLDVYLLLDLSGSMSAEYTALKNNASTALNNVRCPPAGAGTPGQCVDDLWAGVGTLGYSLSGANAYTNRMDLQQNPNIAALGLTEPSGCCAEVTNFSLYATITAQGGGPFGAASVPARTTCAGSPAATAGYPTYGYPCFRNGALPVVALSTDEGPITGADTNHTPAAATVTSAFTARQARIVGLLGDSYGVGTDTDLASYATGTGAVDGANGNAPIVVSAGGANAATGFTAALETLITGTPLDLTAPMIDDPSDSVNAVQAFVDHIETNAPGSASCAVANDTDTNGDTFDDQYNDVSPGTPLCWRVIPKTNTTVPQVAEPQLFRFYVDVVLDGISTTSHQEVFVLVPEA